MSKLSLTREQVHVISAVTFGNVLEWFEIYSFAYLAPIISRQFFAFNSNTYNLIFSFLIFGLGFVTRPIGGIIFGRIGDRLGRKKAFFWSIVWLTLPTALMGAIPNYAQWGLFAPVTLFCLRLIQSIPTGGEIPGTICFLFENSDNDNRRFITSWNAVGNQIGAMLGLLETFLMDRFMTTDFLYSWGWRISFFSGGLIGLVGIYLRHTLHETPVFDRLKQSHNIDRETIKELLSNYRDKLITGTAFGVIDAATFYLIATYVPTFIGGSLKLSTDTMLFISFMIILITTVLLPIFGRMGDKLSNRAMCIGSALLVLLLLYPLSIAVTQQNLLWLAIIGGLYLIPITCITSLIAFLLGDLFPAPVRFTGVGITVNLADGIVGGFTPAIALILYRLTGSPAAFCWYILACALISLAAYTLSVKK